MKSESDNPVVAEYDVFVAAGDGKEVSILQFPLMPASRGFSSEIEQAFWDSNSCSYQLKISTGDFEGDYAANQIKNPQPQCIAVIHGDQIHLTPIESFYRITPIQGESNQSDDTNNEGIPSKKPIDLTQGVPTTPFFAASSTDISSSMNATLYVDLLGTKKADFSPQLAAEVKESDLPSHTPAEQLYITLVKENVIHFNSVLQNLKLEPYAKDLCKVLLKYGLFVQGRWVVKSEHCKDLPMNFRLARNFILVVFSHVELINHSQMKQWQTIFNLQNDQLQKILGNIARAQRMKKPDGNGQEEKFIFFRYKENKDFEDQYPDIADAARKEMNKMKASIIEITRNPDVFKGFIE